MALVYDLFGNGRTAIKYSLNRYNLSRTTGIAANYNPLVSPDGDAAVARRQRQRHRRGRAAAAPATRAPAARSTSPACRRTSASPPSTNTATIRAPGTSSRASRCSTSCLAGVSVSGSWWKGDFRNLTTTINRVVYDGRLHAVHLLQPAHRPAVRGLRAHACSAAAHQQPRHLRPRTREQYEAFNFEGRWRIPGGGQVLRRHVVRARAGQDLHLARRSQLRRQRQGACDEFALDIPFRPNFKLSGTRRSAGASTSPGVPEQLRARPAPGP